MHVTETVMCHEQDLQENVTKIRNTEPSVSVDKESQMQEDINQVILNVSHSANNFSQQGTKRS